jgi:D-alanyl-D-alanine carboxypeptidase
MFVRTASPSFVSPRHVFTRLVVAFVAAIVLAVAAAAPARANPLYAAYVIDAKTGQVLFSRNGDSRRYPASLTKMMTLYLVFEALEAGRISKSSGIRISAKAAAEQPSKIGLKAGSTITVENAILSLVTKSANDIATAIGESLGGSESNFAQMMTNKARQLGMNSTQFRNAHGLPNSQQFTSARDMAILGIALREHFPNQYSYFSTRSFKLGGATYGNHNKLLGRVKGVDGIKTGYIRASGFNLVSSVQDGGRSVVAVVMGGQSGASRDAHMAELIRTYLPKASRGGGGPLIASRKLTPGAPVAIAGMNTLPSRNIPTPAFRPAGEIEVAAYAPDPASRVTPPAPIPAPQVDAGVAIEAETPLDPVQTSSVRPTTGWAVQVGSSPSEREALEVLARTGEQASGVVGSARAFTEIFNNKGTTYYRARFGGFDTKTAAWNACNALKRQRIDCYAVEL